MVQVHVLEAEDCNVVSNFLIHLRLKIDCFFGMFHPKPLSYSDTPIVLLVFLVLFSGPSSLGLRENI